MDKNSIIGFILIAAILFGFTFYQSRQEQTAVSSAYSPLAVSADTVRTDLPAALPEEASVKEPAAAIFKDSMLDSAYVAASEIVVLENDRLKVEFNTRGACPHSVKVKDYYNYDGSELQIFKPGDCRYSISLYTGEYIETGKFNLRVAELTDTSVTMRLPFTGEGYIEQKYVLRTGSYSLDNMLSFVGLDRVIPRNVSVFDLDLDVTLPRMEKGYKNEAQYSKLDYYFDGDKKPVEIGRGRNASKRIDSRLSWFAFQQQFFSAIMRAPEEFSSGELSVNFLPQEDPERRLMECSAKMRCELKHGRETRIPFEFYFGPNHFRTLKDYGCKYEKIIPLGGWLVGWFTRYVIIPIFNFFSRFIDNFGIIILLMTIVIKTVILPFTNKSFLSSAKMAALKPEIEKISAKFPKQEDAMKKQQATMDLYRRAGINPVGGCLPMLITLPVLWAMFRFFPASIELRQQSFLWCRDLSAYDSILDYGTRIPLLGDHLSLFALLMAVTMWVYSKMTMANQPTANDPNAASMRFMSLWMMPIMMFFICNSVSAALSYYYLLSQLYSIIQNWVIRKWFVNTDEILAKVKASEGKPVPKSKWQQRLEAAQKMQEQRLKEQQRKRR